MDKIYPEDTSEQGMETSEYLEIVCWCWLLSLNLCPPDYFENNQLFSRKAKLGALFEVKQKHLTTFNDDRSI